MYQEIDDGDDVEVEPSRGSSRWVWASMAVAFVTLGFITVLSMPTSDRASDRVAADVAEVARKAYLSALGETSPALRRARLEDFRRTYPQSERMGAVTAQLSVLEAQEASDWAAVTDALYDRGLSNLDRLAALDAYEAEWGPNLLGGRSEDIAGLREQLDADVEANPPSRKLEEGDSPIPESIQGSSMAGGPIAQLPPVTITLPPQPPEPEVERLPRRVEVPPRPLREPTPRYPSSAERRGIGAVVELEMDVDEDGRVDDVRILRVDAERYGKDFARAAERAAKRTRFSPRTLDGQPVPTRSVKKRYIFEP